MKDDWDDKLAELETTLRAGDRDAALAQFLAFDAELARYVRGEERLLFPALERFTGVPARATANMRKEHRSLRRLVDTIGELIARRDRPRGLEVIENLRSVLLLHMAKEEWVLSPLLRPLQSSPTP